MYTGPVIPKTIIKMVKTALPCMHALGYEFDSAAELSKRQGSV